MDAWRRILNRTTPDTWTGVVLFIAATVYWIEAGKIRISPLDGPVGASGLPKALAYVLGGLALVLIVRSISQAKTQANASLADSLERHSLARWIKPHLRALGMLAIGVAYLLLLPLFGYALTVAALLLAVSLYNGAGFNRRTLLVAICGFVQFLGIAMPFGKLPSLIEVSF